MKDIIKILIYILIITLFLHKIYYSQTSAITKKVRQYIFVSKLPQSCSFESNNYVFELPDCRDYIPGTTLKIEGYIEVHSGSRNMVSDTGFFEKKRLIVESISINQSYWSSPEVWFGHLLYIFQVNSLLILRDFLPIFDVETSYLIGSLSLGFTQERVESIDHLFKVTGTQYLASISGYHLNLFVGIFSTPLKKLLSRRQAALVSIAVGFLYLLLVGVKIPLVRAFQMLIFSVISTSYLLRQNNSMRALFLIALILIYIDLSVLISISFQLSFVATASIIFFVSSFKHKNTFGYSELEELHLGAHISREKLSNSNYKKSYVSGIYLLISKYFHDSIMISLYVQIALIPLLIYHFHEFSFISLIVSVLLTWLIPGLMLGFFFSLLLSILEVNIVFMHIISLPLVFISELFLGILRVFDNEIFLIKFDDFAWWWVPICWISTYILVRYFTRKNEVLPLVKVL